MIGLRADFFGHCAGFPDLAAAQERPQIVGPMSPEQLETVIRRPAEMMGLRLQDGLMELLLEDMGAHSAADPGGVLPLLSHALLVTWQYRENGVLTVAAYRATGGISRAIATTADNTFESLNERGRRLARRILLRLLWVGEGVEAVRRQVPPAELLPADDQSEQVLDRFVAARLVMVGENVAQITHEALLRHWPRLATWLREDQAGLLVSQRVEGSAAVWKQEGRHPTLLDRGPRLEATLTWLGEGDRDLSDLAKEFVEASDRAEKADLLAERRRGRVRRVVIVALATLLVLAVTGGAFALNLRDQADQAKIVASSQQAAARADALRGVDPALAMQLGLVSYRISPTVEARGSLLSSFGSPYATRLLGHQGLVTFVRFRPDGKVLASVGADHTVRFWDVAAQRETGRIDAGALGHGEATEVAWSPDGHSLLVNAGSTARASLWNVADPRNPVLITPLGEKGQGWTVAVHPNGRIFAVSGSDGLVVLWELDGKPRRVAALTPAFGRSDTLSFSSDGRFLLESLWGVFHSRLWSLEDSGRVRDWSVVSDSYFDSVIAPERDVIARASVENAIVVTPIKKSGKEGEPIKLALPQQSIPSVLSFTSDAGTLAAAYANENTVRVWDVGARKIVVTLPHTGPVRSVDITRDGTSVATAGGDGAVRVWPLPGSSAATHKAGINAVAFSPDGGVLASAGLDGSRLWQITDRTRLQAAASLEGAPPMRAPTVCRSLSTGRS